MQIQNPQSAADAKKAAPGSAVSWMQRILSQGIQELNDFSEMLGAMVAPVNSPPASSTNAEHGRSMGAESSKADAAVEREVSNVQGAQKESPRVDEFVRDRLARPQEKASSPERDAKEEKGRDRENAEYSQSAPAACKHSEKPVEATDGGEEEQTNEALPAESEPGPLTDNEQAVPALPAENTLPEAIAAAASLQTAQPVVVEKNQAESDSSEDSSIEEEVSQSTDSPADKTIPEKVIKDLAAQAPGITKHADTLPNGKPFPPIGRMPNDSEQAAKVIASAQAAASAQVSQPSEAERQPQASEVASAAAVSAVSAEKSSELSRQQIPVANFVPEAVLAKWTAKFAGNLSDANDGNGLDGINAAAAKGTSALSGKEAQAQIAPQTSSNSGSGNGGEAGLQNSANSSRKAESSQATKVLTRLQSSTAFERVEAVLKKAAESKDGSTISLRLDPPDLGTVKVDVSLKDGVLHARMVAEIPAVQQLLRERAPELQVTLRKLGIDVDKVSVSVNSDFQSSGDKEGHAKGKRSDPGQSFSAEMGTSLESPATETMDHWVA